MDNKINYKDTLVYNGWLKVYSREINDKKYDILKPYDAVSCIISNNKDEILLVKQFRPSVLKETLEIPAGCLDIEGEEPIDCLIREILEETGFSLNKDNVKYLFKCNSSIGHNSGILHMFYTKINENKINQVNDSDVTEMEWIKLSEVKKLINEGIICDTKTIVSYYYLLNQIIEKKG